MTTTTTTDSASQASTQENPPRYCAHCGCPGAAGARFCIGCGQALYVTSPVAPVATRVTTTVNVAAAAPAAAGSFVMVSTGRPGHGIIVRSLYFLLVGWWLGPLAIGTALALMGTIVLLPVGLLVLNRLPQIMTLGSAAGGMSTTILAHGAGGIGTGTAPVPVEVAPYAQTPPWAGALIAGAGLMLVILVLWSVL